MVKESSEFAPCEAETGEVFFRWRLSNRPAIRITTPDRCQSGRDQLKMAE